MLIIHFRNLFVKQKCIFCLFEAYKTYIMTSNNEYTVNSIEKIVIIGYNYNIKII